MSNFPSPFDGDADGLIELKIPASSQWVRVARLTVAGVASRLHFGIDAVEDIKLAVAEAINNAIQHAPVAHGGAPSVTITLESDENGLWISVTDEGRVHGTLGISESPTEPSEAVETNDLPEGGLGILLIRSLMDEVSYESGAHADTVVKMFKRLPTRISRAA
ncbi:anti-sigma B factor RsbW [bacterium]|nr:MAG: anti-sigma B factor RsbW [bacterium]